MDTISYLQNTKHRAISFDLGLVKNSKRETDALGGQLRNWRFGRHDCMGVDDDFFAVYSLYRYACGPDILLG
jgi:hypothetical protein